MPTITPCRQKAKRHDVICWYLTSVQNSDLLLHDEVLVPTHLEDKNQSLGLGHETKSLTFVSMIIHQSIFFAFLVGLQLTGLFEMFVFIK